MDENRWLALMAQLGLQDNRDQWRALQNAYAEKHRHYHTDEHIAACLHHLDVTWHLAENPVEIELALWFHDAIYKPRSPPMNWTAPIGAANSCKRIIWIHR